MQNSFFSLACQCNAEGAVNNSCADGEGQCTCKPNITGDKCDKCAPGFFGFPNCQGMIICLLQLKAKSSNIFLTIFLQSVLVTNKDPKTLLVTKMANVIAKKTS